MSGQENNQIGIGRQIEHSTWSFTLFMTPHQDPKKVFHRHIGATIVNLHISIVDGIASSCSSIFREDAILVRIASIARYVIRDHENDIVICEFSTGFEQIVEGKDVGYVAIVVPVTRGGHQHGSVAGVISRAEIRSSSLTRVLLPLLLLLLLCPRIRRARNTSASGKNQYSAKERCGGFQPIR